MPKRKIEHEEPMEKLTPKKMKKSKDGKSISSSRTLFTCTLAWRMKSLKSALWLPSRSPIDYRLTPSAPRTSPESESRSRNHMRRLTVTFFHVHDHQWHPYDSASCCTTLLLLITFTTQPRIFSSSTASLSNLHDARHIEFAAEERGFRVHASHAVGQEHSRQNLETA